MHCSTSPTYMAASSMYTYGSFCYLNSFGTSTFTVNSTGHAHFISSSSSLALQRYVWAWLPSCPFYSVHTSCSPSFHAHIPQVQFTIFHSLQFRSSFFSLSSWFPFQYHLSFTIHSATYSSHSKDTYFNYG